MDLIDIGLNLAHSSFRSDRQVVLDRAIAAGVTTMVITGASLAGSRDALTLAETYPGRLYCTVGIHPHEAKDCDHHTPAALAALCEAPQVVAVGETGLDFNRDYSPRPVQEHWLEHQLELACALDMPVFLHERDAHARFLAIVGRYRPRLPKAVIHCFTGSARELDAYLDFDLHVGITGWICDERRGHHLRELVPRIPLTRLMLETDAPYLLPRDLVPRPGSRRNEPAYLPHIAATVAACLDLPVAALAAATTATARAFFGLPTPPE